MEIELGDVKSRIKSILEDEKQYWGDIYKLFVFEIPNADRSYPVQLRRLCLELIQQPIYTAAQLEETAKDTITKNRWHANLWPWYVEKITARGQLDEIVIRQRLQMLMAEKGKDSSTSLIDKHYVFPTGLAGRLFNFIGEHNLNCQISDLRSRYAIPFDPRLITIKLRPYQQAAIMTAINNKLYQAQWNRGVFQIPTGGGKTEVAIALIQAHHHPSFANTVFLVNRKELLYQTYERIQVALPQEKVGIIGDDKFIYSPTSMKIVVASVQTIWSILKQKKAGSLEFDAINRLLSGTTQLIIDEAHGLAASEMIDNTMVKVCDSFISASLRWGLTATPMMRDDLSNALLTGVTGDVIFKMTNDELIKQGFLTKPKVVLTKVNHHNSYEDPITKQELQRPPGKQWKELYDFAIVHNPFRNKAIADILNNIPTPAIVLVQRLDHITYLNHHSANHIQFLRGTSTPEEREEAKRKLRSGEIKILGATTIFDEGVDIPEIRAIVMAGGGKSNIKTLQRLGRGLRLAKGKDEVLIYDFIDFNSNSPDWIPMKHSRERVKVYKQEGFEIESR